MINGYFSKVREANPGRWEAARGAYISTNPGVRAHLLLLADVIKYLSKRDDTEVQLLDEDTLLKNVLRVVEPALHFIRVADDDDIYDKFSRKFGEGGVRSYADNLSEIVLGKLADFGSDDFKERLAKRLDERGKQADQDVIQFARDISDYVFKILKDKYGTERGNSGQPKFFDEGIESPKIKQEAFSRMLAENSKLPPWAYVDGLGIKEIITQKNNWEVFENVFSIPMKGEAKGKHHYVGWLARFNEIRRVPAHSSGIRTYEEKDYEDLKHFRYEFYKRRNTVLGISEAEE